MLVGHWPLIGNTNDYSGFNNNGTPTSITYTAGKIGQAGNFNGTNSLITTNLTQASLQQEFTISAWVYALSGANYKGVLGDHLNFTGIVFCQYQEGTAYFTYGNGSAWVTIANISLPLNTWHHVTMVIKTGTGGYGKVYLNGIQQGSTLNNPSSFSPHNNILIGRAFNSSNRYWSGQINDVRVYNHALSDYEIKELAKAKILHYTFDDPNEEPTINLVPTPLTFTNTASTWGARENVTVTYDQLDPFGGTNAVRVKPNSTTDNYFGSRNTTLGTGTFTTSLWLKATKTTTLRVRIGTGNLTNGFVDYTANLTTVWQRYEFTGTITATPSHMIHLGGWGTWTDNTFDAFIAFPQIEKKTYSTLFVDGIRNIGTADLSGLKYNNFPTTTITPRWSSISKLGSNSILFNGASSHHLNLTEISAMPFNTGMSFSVWAYPTASSNWARFVDFGNGAPSNNILFTRQSTSATIHLESFNNTSSTTLTSTNAIENNVWQHFAFTIASNGAAKIYKNGIVIASGTVNVPNVITRNNMYIGRSNWVADSYYNGYMDDIRIYTEVLSDADILALYNRRANFDNLGNVSSNEIFLPANEAFAINQAIINQTFTDGLSRFQQSNCQVTATADGVRIFRPANLFHPANGNTMWGGMVLLLPESLKTIGNNYILRFKIKGQTSVDLHDNRFAFAVGWTDFGVGLTGHSIQRTTLRNLTETILPDYIETLWKYTVNSNRLQNPRWTINVTAGSNVAEYVNKHPSALNIINGSTLLNNSFFPNGTTVTSVTNNVGFTTSNNATQTGQFVVFSSTQYDTYGELKFGFGYNNTGVLGTDLFIKDVEVFNVTSGELIKIDPNGILMYYDIDEVTGTQNTNAKQEINNNGTLLINGEFSEVD